MKNHWTSYALIISIAALGGYVAYKQFFSGSKTTDQPAATEQPAPTAQPAPTPAPTPAGDTNASNTTPAKDPANKDTPQNEGSSTAPEEPKGDDILVVEEDDNKQSPFALPQVTGKKGDQSLAQALHSLLGRTDKAEALAQLVQQGWISQEQADELHSWIMAAEQIDGSDAIKLTPVGTHLDGEKNLSRFVLEAPNGEQLYLDLLAPRSANQPWTLQSLQPAQKGKLDATAAANSIHVVEQFIRLVSQGNMLGARELSTGKGVSDATVAGLCMVFAEGGYHLRSHAPIRASFENKDRAGYLVYLIGEQGHQPAFVGVELALDPQAGWQIDGVSLDSLLESYEKSAGEEGGRYFPIVKLPQGGDSLVLFFAFDDSQLTPRSLRQLKIVADMLKNSPRKLDISGHTDDIGSERYNQDLSLQRAAAVMKALVNFGVSPGQITMKGLGKSQPRRGYNNTDMDDQQLETLRAENRRAEIYLDFN